MLFLKIFQVLFCLWAIYLVWSQFFWPAVKGKQLLPFLNKRRARIAAEAVKVREDIDVSRFEETVDALKKTKIKTKTKTTQE